MLTKRAHCSLVNASKLISLVALLSKSKWEKEISKISIDMQTNDNWVNFVGNVNSQEKWACQIGVDFLPTVLLVLDLVGGECLADDLVDFTPPWFLFIKKYIRKPANYGFALTQSLQI